jgi:LmbE family N-acetylglucosaminyl deacetylase
MFGLLLLVACSVVRAAEPEAGAAILHELKSFNTVATVLHVAAHPDDENTQLITYFARARGYRMGYLSVTRGDGGQNEIGPEFDEKLGVARTQELLAARRIDGGRQFFTRAIDFGFSKTAEETLVMWDRSQVLGDVVRVIRMFRPDVIVTRFSPGSSGETHGHHTASGILGVEAFKLAGDPKAYPEQLTQGLTVWQPKRVVLNAGGGGGGAGKAGKGGAAGAPVAGAIRVDIGGLDPVTKEGLGAIAGRSRGQHITQGFGNFAGRGGPGTGPNEQTFVPLGGEVATKDLMDGIDTTWARVPGGAEIGRLTEEAITQFKGDHPAGSVPALLAIRTKLTALPKDPLVEDKRRQLDAIIRSCLGLEVETSAPTPEALPGEALPVQVTATLRSTVPVTWKEVRTPGGNANMNVALISGAPVTRAMRLTVPANMAPTHPYWLREEPVAGIATVTDPKLIGLPENPSALPFEYRFEVGGQTLSITDEAMYTEPIGVKSPPKRRLDIVPPVSVMFVTDVAVIPPGQSRPVSVEVVAARGNTNGSVDLVMPSGWSAKPVSQSFRLAGAGEKVRLTFDVNAPRTSGVEKIGARARINGVNYSTQRTEIRYSHIPVQLLQPPARLRAVALDVAAKGKNVGYLPGAGDDVAEAIEHLGYKVTMLTGADLTAEKLQGLDAVVVGVRAFNEREDLAANLPGLFAYVENGGTVITQYNRPNGLLAQKLGPYELSIQGPAPALRVTVENSLVTFASPDHPILNIPNKITQSDFAGWVQERGAYFPSSWDQAHYESVLAMSDPGEAPLKSSVLVAKHGKGHYVYTGLAFFRQLPAGVPGAYRLFANLLSLGK